MHIVPQARNTIRAILILQGRPFGFKFDGDVQYSILYPAPGQENHPVWNVPNQVSEFSDWCCDAYVGEIEDEENITVLSTVSGDSYGPTGYSTVQNVPAIIVNNNPKLEWRDGDRGRVEHDNRMAGA